MPIFISVWSRVPLLGPIDVAHVDPCGPMWTHVDTFFRSQLAFNCPHQSSAPHKLDSTVPGNSHIGKLLSLDLTHSSHISSPFPMAKKGGFKSDLTTKKTFWPSGPHAILDHHKLPANLDSRACRRDGLYIDIALALPLSTHHFSKVYLLSVSSTFAVSYDWLKKTHFRTAGA